MKKLISKIQKFFPKNITNLEYNCEKNDSISFSLEESAEQIANKIKDQIKKYEFLICSFEDAEDYVLIYDPNYIEDIIEANSWEKISKKYQKKEIPLDKYEIIVFHVMNNQILFTFKV